MLASEQTHAARILVAGDVMLGRYWSEDVDRILLKISVPAVQIKCQGERPGGAANVARDVATLGM